MTQKHDCFEPSPLNTSTSQPKPVSDTRIERLHSKNILIPVHALSRIDIESRAESLGISKRAIQILHAPQSFLFPEPGISIIQQSKSDASSLMRTTEWLTRLNVTKDEWTIRWDNFCEGIQKLTEFLDKTNSNPTVEDVKKNHALCQYLASLAKDEIENEPCSLLLSLCLENKISELQNLADFQKPSFDWRETYTKVIETAYTPHKSKFKTKPDQESISCIDVSTTAKSLNIPHVAYSPASYYEDGPVIFPISKEDINARTKFSKLRESQLDAFEQRLLNEGCSVELFHSCWSFFCEYTQQICDHQDAASNKKTIQEYSHLDTCKWLSWVSRNSESLLPAQLFSLMIDNINSVLSKDKHQEIKSPIDWRDQVASITSFTVDEILEYYEDLKTIGLESDNETISTDVSSDQSDSDSDGNEFSFDYEKKRAAKLSKLQEEFDLLKDSRKRPVNTAQRSSDGKRLKME